MEKHEKLNYIELASRDMEATKAFFSKVFGWSFRDYGPDYSDCPDGGMMVGFFRSDLASTYKEGGALLTFFSEDLEATQAKIEDGGGKIVQPIFSFPGGRRFHFTEPSGNEFGVWSDLNENQDKIQ